MQTNKLPLCSLSISLTPFTLAWQLDRASRDGEESEVQDLLLKGADPNSDWRPLHWACFNNHACCARLLIQGGASLNFTDTLGQVALHYACMSNSMDCVTLLLSHKSPIGEPRFLPCLVTAVTCDTVYKSIANHSQ